MIFSFLFSAPRPHPLLAPPRSSSVPRSTAHFLWHFTSPTPLFFFSPSNSQCSMCPHHPSLRRTPHPLPPAIGLVHLSALGIIREVATAISLQAEIAAYFADRRISLAFDEDAATHFDVEIVLTLIDVVQNWIAEINVDAGVGIDKSGADF